MKIRLSRSRFFFCRFRSEFFVPSYTLLIDLHRKCRYNVNIHAGLGLLGAPETSVSETNQRRITSHERRLDLNSFANSEFHLLNIRVL
jgi:hypothetical protein